MSQTMISTEGPLVLVGAPNGRALISSGTPLTRLNYFDGKFLRAEDLNREQLYVRSLVGLSNQAGGSGIVHGFTASLAAGGMLDLSPGLAVDPAGRLLYLQHGATVGIMELIEASRQFNAAGVSTAGGAAKAMGEGAFADCEVVSATPPVTTTFPTDLYLIALSHGEALCGEEDVYGKLCEDACVTSTDRPFRLEGVVVRAIPLSLCPPTCTAPWLTATHRRSQVASAYYATERMLLGKDMSGARLKLDLWCQGAAAQGGTVVPLAVVAVNGSTVEFLDQWTARRERIDNPPRHFWAWQMMMRPWSVYLAQILQFQCHLHEVLADPGVVAGGPDPCTDKTAALRDAVSLLEEMEKEYAAAMAGAGTGDVFRPDFLTRVASLKAQVGTALVSGDAPAGVRILIDGGIVELPAAGYLPVVPGTAVNEQVRALLGDGVDLRFCSVRPDYVAHALEEAQHMERICLLQGIEKPDQAQEVDILVPDGIVVDVEIPQGRYYETSLAVIVPSGDVLSVGTAKMATNDAPPPAPAAGEAATMETDATVGQPNVIGGMNEVAVTDVKGVHGPEFRGASRSEALPTGGGAYHFAGLLVQPIEQLVVNVGRSYQRSYDKRKLDDTGAGTGDAWNSVGLDDLVSRFAGLGSEQPRMMKVETAAAPSSPPAIWTTMRCDKNPFALAVGESTPVKLEAAVGASVRGYLAGAQLVLQGDFFCDQTPASATTRNVKGRARGWAFVNARVDVGGTTKSFNPDPVFIPVTAELALEPEVGGIGRVIVTVTTQQGVEFSITTGWKGTSLSVLSSVTIDVIDTFRAILTAKLAGNPERLAAVDTLVKQMEEKRPELRALEVLRARLTENADVRNDANGYHAAAAKALRTIGTALNDEGYQRAAERLLFPPAPPKTKEKRVLPTRDWVLFHRRRSNSCDCCTPEKKVAAPPARFQLYEITAERATVAEIREALAKGKNLEKLADVVGVMEFEGGTAQLTGTTNPAQILEGWRLANPASTILYGAIANEGATLNDPEVLGEQRVGRAADIVKTITPLDPNAPFDVLPLVPVGLSAQGVDGVILFVTVSAQTQRHRVVSLRDQGMMSFVITRIGQGELAAIIEENQQVLGGVRQVEFQGGSDTVVGNSLQPVVDAWNAKWTTAIRVARALVVLPTADAIPTALAEQQAGAIAAALRGTLTEPTMTSAEDAFDGCEAITILEPSQRDQ